MSHGPRRGHCFDRVATCKPVFRFPAQHHQTRRNIRAGPGLHTHTADCTVAAARLLPSAAPFHCDARKEAEWRADTRTAHAGRSVADWQGIGITE